LSARRDRASAGRLCHDDIKYRTAASEQGPQGRSQNLHDSAGAAANFDLSVESGNKAVALEPGDDANLWELYQAQWSQARNLKSQGKRSDALTVFEHALQNAKQTTHTEDVTQLQREIAELGR
jgi:hypothetical protein